MPPPNKIIINAGQWRSRVITFPDVAGLRPTPNRVRETLFNWLGQTLTDLACIDLFAGSGALGFEAASRGAARVLMCETDRAALAALRTNAALLALSACEIVARDCFDVLARSDTKFDLAFCDPPFAARQHEAVLTALLPRLTTKARVYIESPQATAAINQWPIVAQHFVVVKQACAGAVQFALLSRATTEEFV